MAKNRISATAKTLFSFFFFLFSLYFGGNIFKPLNCGVWGAFRNYAIGGL
jgi:hypothetical protein